jgi:DNA-binding NarL/FixJ family response regulator
LPSPYENVRLLIADSSPMVRTGLKGALYSQGFRSVTDTSSYVRIRDLLDQDAVDLLITSCSVEESPVSYLIQEMRHHRLGRNPFVMVIMLLANSEPDYVRTAIDSGADDLLVTPVAPDQLIRRIAKLAGERRPFVVTHSYVGPDRRGKPRPFENSAALLPVPNPLRARAQDGMDGTRLNRQVRDCALTLNLMQIDAHGTQLNWLVTHINASIRDGGVDANSLAAHTSRLVFTAEDMMRRIENTAAAGHANTLAELQLIARKLHADATTVTYPELEHLQNMARTIARAVNGLATTVRAAV